MHEPAGSENNKIILKAYFSIYFFPATITGELKMNIKLYTLTKNTQTASKTQRTYVDIRHTR